MGNKKRFLVALVSGGFGVLVVLSSHIAALMNVRQLSLIGAVSTASNSFITELVGSIVLILPFAFLGYYLSSKKKRDFIYIIPLLLIIPYYFYRYHRAEILMTEKYWTASALSVGLLPIHSAMLILLSFGIKHLILNILESVKDTKEEDKNQA